MAEQFAPFYDSFIGVDVVTPYVRRGPSSAEILQNWCFLPSGSLGPRPGWKYVADNSAGNGLLKYVRRENGSDTTTFLAVGDVLYEISDGNLRVSYTGASANVLATCVYDTTTSQWRFQILEEVAGVLTEKLNFALGNGVDVVSPVTLANLKTAIDAISGGFYSATITGSTSLPAAFLPSTYREPLVGSPTKILDLPTRYTTAIRRPDGAPANFVNHQAGRNTAKHRNATSINYSDVIYIATETDLPQKYDGQIAYNMGMPQVSSAVSQPGTGTGITATWRYLVRYSHTDAKGNYNPGPFYPELDNLQVVLSNKAHALVSSSCIQDSSGYSTDFAKVNGPQAAVTTITVDSGHTLQEGDKVMLLDRSLSGAAAREAVERTVVSTGATTITVDSAVSVSDNDIISQNLLIEIYRTKNLGTTYYTLALLPNDPSQTDITYTDSVADTALGDEIIEPERSPDPPPIGGVIVEYQGVPVITRIPDSPSDILWGEQQYPEGFPSVENRRSLNSPMGGGITGLWANVASLDIFYPTSTRRLYGTLFDGQLEFRKVSDKIGLPHHNCLDELDSGQAVWLSNVGPRQMGPGGRPQRVGIPWDVLLKRSRVGEKKYVLEKSLVVDLPNEQMCYFFLNCESGSANLYTNTYSEVWVLDYQLENDIEPGANYRWIGPWRNMNMSGGAIDNGNKMMWIERRLEDNTSNIVHDIVEQLNNGDDFDAIDHSRSRPMLWKPGFEDKGNKFLKAVWEQMRFYSSDLQNQSGFTVYVGIEKNFLPSELVNLKLVFGNGGASEGWAFEAWGSFAWGNPTADLVESKFPITEDVDSAANALRITIFHDKIYERPIITSFGFLISAPYKMGLARG